MQTRHTKQAPAGVPSRAIKKPTIVEIKTTVPADVEGEEPKTIVKKVIEFVSAHRSKMNSRMARKARKSGVEFLPVA